MCKRRRRRSRREVQGTVRTAEEPESDTTTQRSSSGFNLLQCTAIFKLYIQKSVPISSTVRSRKQRRKTRSGLCSETTESRLQAAFKKPTTFSLHFIKLSYGFTGLQTTNCTNTETQRQHFYSCVCVCVSQIRD